MPMSFFPDEIFSKGIVEAEFFDPATDNLLGYSKYVGDFNPAGSMNNGEVAGGPGNGLIMMIPDTCRLAVTATTVDSNLHNIALTVGSTVQGNGVIETVIGLTADSATLSLSNAAAPLGGENGKVAYVLTSTGSDKATVEAASGTAYSVDDNGDILGFTAVATNTYCVKYYVQNSSAEMMKVPSLFAPKVVRAHFKVNCYAKKTGGDVMASSLYKIRHYIFPYYYFTNPLNDTLGQTSTGTVNLSGSCLSYSEALANGTCVTTNTSGYYGYIVDELIDGSSTALVDGIYFIGLGSGASVVRSQTATLPVMYSVNGVLTSISDMSAVTFTSAATATASFADAHENVVTGVAAGTTSVTATVTNSATGITYTDTIPITVTAS